MFFTMILNQTWFLQCVYKTSKCDNVYAIYNYIHVIKDNSTHFNGSPMTTLANHTLTNLLCINMIKTNHSRGSSKTCCSQQELLVSF